MDIDWNARIRPAGDRAVLITLDDPRPVQRLASALRVHAIAGVEDVLPAAETVLVTMHSVSYGVQVRRELVALLDRLDHEPPQADSPDVSRGTVEDPEPVVEIPVRYDGADLPEVARLLELSIPEVIAAHTGTVWRCAFVGFAPGFGYLTSPDGRLTVPRRTHARTAIPAGAVALAGGYSAVYPRGTPGGWQLIGSTDLRMWAVDRDPPALVRAGSAIRFVDSGE
ncbi:5-oxoprolinase subunit B family protein [Nocardia fluminea]|uniref:KipI family sensor histidine kinase inhibitor n=1 Tax=Nocardia fluminea TaxID=134984 RepID=A0A2N3VAR4_9NOCA|nr:allophanate hydrolase subunit 1 [Nocardia fluminea]PKV78676.1 KipI family sensor histidine kinase inhibitor [Nocardia fluminea]